MPMRAHELHPALVHAPLTLIPAAAIADIAALAAGSRRKAQLGASLWRWGAWSGGVAGFLGLAASQQVKADDEHAADMMWLHGIGNVALLAVALGISTWRRRHAPSLLQVSAGVLGCAGAVYTAYLGGQLVYAHGVGVKAMAAGDPTGVRRSPAVVSSKTPTTTVRDAVAGLRWLVSRTVQVLTGKREIDRKAARMDLTEKRARLQEGAAAETTD